MSWAMRKEQNREERDGVREPDSQRCLHGKNNSGCVDNYNSNYYLLGALRISC